MKRIYAQIVSDAGRIMAQKLYFGPLYVIQNNQLVRVKDTYVLDMNEASSFKIIREFQERLKKKEYV